MKKVIASDEFKKAERAAAPFLNDVHDFVFGRPATLENIVSYVISNTYAILLTFLTVQHLGLHVQ